VGRLTRRVSLVGRCGCAWPQPRCGPSRRERPFRPRPLHTTRRRPRLRAPGVTKEGKARTSSELGGASAVPPRAQQPWLTRKRSRWPPPSMSAGGMASRASLATMPRSSSSARAAASRSPRYRGACHVPAAKMRPSLRSLSTTAMCRATRWTTSISRR
jgi:hypothetical protein